MPGPFDFQPFQGFDVGAGPQRLQPFDPTQEQDFLTRLGNKAMGGLEWMGQTLDKPGRAVRGLLAGRPEELLNLVPFSDTAGLTDPANSVSGADLLEPDKNQQGDAAAIAGFGAEVLTDPLTYLTLGASALTKTGRAAEKLGVLPKNLSGRIRGLAAGSPELARLEQVPEIAAQLAQARAVAPPGFNVSMANMPLGGFANFMGQTLGTGPTAAAAADLLGTVGDKLLYSRPGKVLSSLFDPAASIGNSSFKSEAMQRAAREAQAGIQEGNFKVLGEHLRDVKQIEQHGLQDSARELRGAAEAAVPGPYRPGVQDLADTWRTEDQRMLTEAQQMGRDIGEYSSAHGEHFPRQKTPTATTAAGAGANLDFTTTSPNQYRRMDPLRELPGETNTVNDILQDPKARAAVGAKVDPQAQHIREKYLGWDSAQHQELDNLKKLNPPERIVDPTNGVSYPNPDYRRLQDLTKEFDKSHELARMSQHADEIYTKEGKDFFGNHPLVDLTTAKLKHNQAQAGAKVIYDALANSASAVAEPGSMPLSEVLKQAGLKDHTLDVAGKQVTVGASDQLTKRGLQNLKDLHVPGEVAADILRYNRTFQSPATLKPLVDLYDTITNITKAFQTSPNPAFHTRNLLTGGYMNLITGATYSGGDLIGPFRDAIVHRGGGTVKNANKVPGLTHLSPDEASKVLREEMFQYMVRHDARSTLAGQSLGLVDQANPLVGSIANPAGKAEKSLGEIAAGYFDFSQPGSRDPRAIAGATIGGKKYNETLFAPARAGREAAGYVDDLNRMSSYLAFRQQGYEPAMAAARSKAAHYDYSALTPFERTVMRRVMPFYSWARHNTPFMLEQLAEKPGGALAQTIRATDAMKPKEGSLTPDYIQEGLSIPLGGRDDAGNQRYLAHFGLPFEDAFSFLSGGPNALQRSAQKVLGQTNPLIKAPLEYASGTQFYSGRQLADLYSRTGTGSPLVDQIVSNSPLGRPVNTISTIADIGRKGPEGVAANLLGPAKITDVNIPQAQRVAARQYVQDAMRGNPNVHQFTDIYVKPEDLAKLTPEQQQLMRLYISLERDARQRSQQQRNFAVPMR